MMKKDLFASMKEQMLPPPSAVEGIYERMADGRRESPLSLGLRACAAGLSMAVACLCVFNMAMPASAEKLPIVGGAFASLNERGRDARESGRTPDFLIIEEEKEDFSALEMTAGLCDGLDLSFFIRYEDSGDLIDQKVRSLTLSDAAVYYEGIALRPTDEAPVLYETQEGVFSGEARFNASCISGLLEDGEEIEFALNFTTVFGYWDGMEKEGGEALEYKVSYLAKSRAYVDLSALRVEYVGLERDGMCLEYIVEGEERTDVLFKINSSVEYADCFLIGTESEAPCCVTMNPGIGSDGSLTYCATFTGEEKPEEGKLEDERESVYISPEDVVFYSTATGEYYYLTEEGKAE